MNTRDWGAVESPWWMGETGLYHAECMQAHNAHATCTCIIPVVESGGNICVNCGMIVRLVSTQSMRRIRELKETPVGVRPMVPSGRHREMI